MGNQWFQCKQFLIKQDKTAMKVGTDGVLLGAWTNIPTQGNVLDVGTGTGLIALMVAQRNSNLDITAIEIEKNAFVQATENVLDSKWSNRIRIIHTSLVDYVGTEPGLFDLIVCNPPFYKTNNPGSDINRGMARHADSLKLEDLLRLSSSVLSKEGVISIILPAEQFELANNIAKENGMFLQKVTYVKPTPYKDPHRVLLQFGKLDVGFYQDELIIEEYGRHQYSDRFNKLVDPFYVRFAK
jgi:tRNA1Val (adenine37-N6)-methyltransferase